MLSNCSTLSITKNTAHAQPKIIAAQGITALSSTASRCRLLVDVTFLPTRFRASRISAEGTMSMMAMPGRLPVHVVIAFECRGRALTLCAWPGSSYIVLQIQFQAHARTHTHTGINTTHLTDTPECLSRSRQSPTVATRPTEW